MSADAAGRSACATVLLAMLCVGAEPFQAVDLNASLAPERLAAKLADKRVIFVGETHDRYDHHLNQLEIIREVHRLDSNIAIGVEYFEARFQSKVDDYIAGRITETEFLRATDYYDEWGYDYRLYAPIFRFAREQHVPVRALNVPTSLPSTVSKVGTAGLTAEQRATLPAESAPADADYRARLREVFQQHGPAKPDAFEHFVEAQLVWDESMAANAAGYLSAERERRMVILTGSGHLIFGSGIPSRLERRIHASYAIVVNGGGDEEVGPHMADYLLLSKPQELPPAGVMGARLEQKDGECRLGALTPGGAAEKTGLKKGDVVVEIDGQPVKRVGDVRLALWERKPGDRVKLNVRRGRSSKVREFEFELAAPKFELTAPKK